MSDPWSKETGDKVEQRLSIEQVCDKYNALTEAFELADGLRRSHQAEIVRLNARVEELEAALRIVPGFVTNRARAEFVKAKLAGTELADCKESDRLIAALQKIRDEPGDARDCRYIAGHALAATVETLEGALREIRDHPDEDGVADSMEAIAREALEGMS